jgi:FAD/FMN-containing dehydrogenase
MIPGAEQHRQDESQGALNGRLQSIVGAVHVLTQAAQLDFYSSDIFDRKTIAEFVVRPGTVEEAAAVVGACTAAGRPVIPRGGGLSYTGGYLPTRAGSVIIDMARLDRIVEINAQDMYVTVEAGVTWNQLYETLTPQGLRTPYWGTVSGYHATIGGGLSQGSTHFGSGEFGGSSDTCLGLQVILADGRLLTTGSGAAIHQPSPFFRYYGPDLTGLFLQDTGALGFKARATLKLIKAPPQQRYATIAFATLEQQFGAMAEVARNRLAAECGGWNPALVRRFGSASTELQEDLKYLTSVVRTGGNLFRGLKDAATLALAGRRDWQQDTFLMHITIDEISAPAADEKLKRVEKIAADFGGRAIPASFPRAHRARPFTSMSALPRTGERSVPTHGICPHSRSVKVAKEVYSIFEQHADLCQRFNITWCLISSTLGTGATAVEPLIYYPDVRGAHYSRIPPEGESPPSFGEADPDTIAAVRTVRSALAQMFMANGCTHLQIGKSYPYRAGREPVTWDVLAGIKALLDPQGLVNPGSLGFDA